jgi:hypothetical protein
MSLIKFHSPTQGSVIMFGENAQTLLDTLGLSNKGEMSTAQLPAYLERLKTAIEADKVTNPVIWPEELNAEEDMNAPVIVRFSQRAAPMVQLMTRCISATEPISW